MEDIVRAIRHGVEALLAHRVEARLLTIEQAGNYIGRFKRAVEHLIRQRELRSIRMGARVHLDRRDLDRWIDDHRL